MHSFPTPKPQNPHYFATSKPSFLLLIETHIIKMKHKSRKDAASEGQEKVLISKCCLHCKTTKTPMWRIGPSGPKSLCNACGIKFRKKSSGFLKQDSFKKEENSRKSRSSDKSKDRSKNGCAEDGETVKKSRRFMKVGLKGFGKDMVLLKRQRSPLLRRSNRKMGEVEQAALLLMALSCGSLSA